MIYWHTGSGWFTVAVNTVPAKEAATLPSSPAGNPNKPAGKQPSLWASLDSISPWYPSRKLVYPHEILDSCCRDPLTFVSLCRRWPETHGRSESPYVLLRCFHLMEHGCLDPTRGIFMVVCRWNLSMSSPNGYVCMCPVILPAPRCSSSHSCQASPVLSLHLALL